MCDRYHRGSSKEWETLCFRDLRLLQPWCAWLVHVRQHENRAGTSTIENMVKSNPSVCGMILHSDRGSQYTSASYRAELSRHGIIQSMNRDRGRCHDNARCEAMWARMKDELLYGRYDTKQMTIEELKTLIWRYFIIYWNNRRICSANGGLPPMIKRKKYYESLGQVA